MAINNTSEKIADYIPNGIYTRKDLLNITSNKTAALAKAFTAIDWIKSGNLASLDNLPQGLFYYFYSRLIGFNDAGTQIRIAHNITYKNLTHQVMIGTWDIVNNDLLKLIVFTPNTKLVAVSADQRWIAIDTDHNLLIYDVHTGKKLHALLKNHHGSSVYDKVVFSVDGRFLATTKIKKLKHSLDGKFNQLTINVFDVYSGKPLKQFVRFTNKRKEARLAFSPDSSYLLIDWHCFLCEPSNQYILANTKDWEEINVGNLNQIISTPEFSGDSQYLVGWTKLFGISERKEIKKYAYCKGSSKEIGKPIYGSSFNLFLGNGKFEYHKIIDGRCLTIAEHNFPDKINHLYFRHIVFSKSLKKIARMQEENGLGVFRIIDSHFPNNETPIHAQQ